jgi:beta-glucosidase
MSEKKTLSLRRALAVIAFAGVVVACTPASEDPGPVDTCDPLVTKANLSCGDADVNRALELLRMMSTEEKVQQMSGPLYNPNNMFDQPTNGRLNIPGFLFMDGPRGVRWYNSDYGTTVYPVAAARGSTWNLELERRIGKAMAQEMRYLGRHILLAPTINQVSHPRWGRAQESYGEDTFLLGEMGRSFIAGAQYDPSVPDPLDPAQPIEDTYRVQACAKHFVANNIEDTRIYVNAVVDERTLREVYLPHFQKAADAGVSCVMSSYNRVNGSYSGYSKDLVRDILKSEWGYSGWVVSDWFAKGNTLTSPVAGLDVEMPFSEGECPSIFDCTYFYGSRLVTAVKSGDVDEKLIDEAALRILYRKVAYGVIDHAPPAWTPWLTKSDATQDLSLESAREGIVLLKNGPTKALADDVLPLDRAALSKLAVVGKFANSENMGDKGSSDAKVVDGSLVITPFEGLKEGFAATNTSNGSCGTAAKCALTFENVAGNEATLATADAVVVVTAYFYADLARSSAGEEGEWKDRVSLALPQRDLNNIANAVALKTRAGANPNLKVVVVAKAGGAIVVNPWIDGVDGLLMAWYAGMKEGTALAEILFGDVNPSGKLVQSFPVAEADLPAFNNTTRENVSYGYYHGYRWHDKQAKPAKYPFGFGLSYTTFEYSNLQVADPAIAADGTLTVTVDVKNTGAVAGSEVVQLYVGYDNTAVTTGWGRPKKELKAFARAENIAPGATQTVTLHVSAGDLGYWDTTAKKFTVEKMAHQLYVGPSADATDANTLPGTFTIE